MTREKKHPFVFQLYKPLFHPSRGQELISGAPSSQYEQGHVYYLTEQETEGCVWWRWADSYDLKFRVIHRSVI